MTAEKIDEDVTKEIMKDLIDEVLSIKEDIQFAIHNLTSEGAHCNEALLIEPEEKHLYTQVLVCEERIAEMERVAELELECKMADTKLLLEEIVKLHPAIVAFLSKIPVEKSKGEIRLNRLNLMCKVNTLICNQGAFERLADFWPNVEFYVAPSPHK